MQVIHKIKQINVCRHVSLITGSSSISMINSVRPLPHDRQHLLEWLLLHSRINPAPVIHCSYQEIHNITSLEDQSITMAPCMHHSFQSRTPTHEPDTVFCTERSVLKWSLLSLWCKLTKQTKKAICPWNINVTERLLMTGVKLKMASSRADIFWWAAESPKSKQHLTGLICWCRCKHTVICILMRCIWIYCSRFNHSLLVSHNRPNTKSKFVVIQNGVKQQIWFSEAVNDDFIHCFSTNQ